MNTPLNRRYFLRLAALAAATPSHMKFRSLLCSMASISVLASSSAFAAKPAILIINGRNNHDWHNTTGSLRATLDSTGIFEVAVSTAPADPMPSPPREPKGGDAAFSAAKQRYEAMTKNAKPTLDAAWAQWLPDFSKYAAVVLDYNGPQWPEPMRQAFVEYVRGGGGVLLVHAANNGFADWPEFNAMIGLGWRKGGFGTCLTIDAATGKPVECCKDDASGHGSKHPFVVTNRVPDHPLLRGLPAEWLHGKDELYHHLRGPAKGVTILASAWSAEKERGSGLHEPVLYETMFGKGRVLVTTMGHFWNGDTEFDSLHCVGFQAIIARGTEYVATGGVTLEMPAGFPTKDQTSSVMPHAVQWGSAVPTSSAPDWKAKKAANEFATLTPEEERATFVLQDGFVAELVAAEPLVQEPVLAVWDGNGAMYVAEMRSYMQDEKGTGTKTLKNGCIKRLTSSKGDGIMDKATVFADGLNLPRMILPLADGIAVVETDSMSVWFFRDTKGTGIADEKKLLYQGKAGDPNHSVEHQDSGLDWNLDNWINISYGRERYRFTDGTWRMEKYPAIWSQWGLTHDDTGRVYYSDNSTPFLGAQLPRQYWNFVAKNGAPMPREADGIRLAPQWEPSFLMAKNLCATDDRGGPAGARKVLTSLCGQSIFRGTALPMDARGDYFFCDPTIHVVRRSKVENQDGRIFIKSAYGEEEFLNSSDLYFRPVNTSTGPDGALTVVDMYRGIIQDAPWLSDGPRKFIKESGMADVHQHGRIWRIRHRDFTPTSMPRMNDEPTPELLRHLENPNGWWRDTAQRLIILRADRESVAPMLADMVRFNQNPLARLHALWTLEGMGKVDAKLVQATLRDSDARMRCAAVRVDEPWIAKNDEALIQSITELAKSERDPEVAKQIILSIGYANDATRVPLIDSLVERNLTHEGVFLAACTVLWKKPSPLLLSIKSGEALKKIKDSTQRALATARWAQGFDQWERGLVLPKDLPQDQRQLITGGEATYYQVCASCHGGDGKGVKIPGTDHFLAPSLAGSARVKGSPAGLVPVLINGLLGPIEGKTYEGQMMTPAIALGITRDDRLAEVLSFIRYSWGNKASTITAEEVKQLHKQHEKRLTPWSDDELKAQGSVTK